MAMTVVVTRNVPDRVRGFLASCMCELGPGVYTAPRMDTAVRDRVWAVLFEWCGLRTDLAVVMTWPEAKLPGGQAVRTLGAPPVELIEHNGVFLARRDLTEDDVRSLTTRFGGRVAPEVPRDAATTIVDAKNDDASAAGTPAEIPQEEVIPGDTVDHDAPRVASQGDAVPDDPQHAAAVSDDPLDGTSTSIHVTAGDGLVGDRAVDPDAHRKQD